MIPIMNAKDYDPAARASNDNADMEAIERRVADILGAVRKEGDAAVRRYTEKFDGAALDAFEVPEEAFEAALSALPPDFIRTLEMAAENIRAFHQRQVRHDYAVTDTPGVVLGQKVMPLQRVGLYVPGGTAAYPSTVLMDAIPAKIAGVPEIVIVTPPGKDGSVNPAVLAAARVAGVSRVYRVGGAQAVAALAYGTETIPKVDKIVGPGNIYVATAKRQVFGLVDIDMIAGPSEILVVADDTATPAYVAADLLSQAEHDRLASSILVTTSIRLAAAVQAELERQIPLLPRAEICRASIDTYGAILLCDTMEEALDTANRIAPEHLELSVADPFALLSKVKNAGSIFLGHYAPEALGDYFAGPNHTLPTSGTARFSSPLSVDDFAKRSSFIYYTREALQGAAGRIADFANREGLDAHAHSITIRFEGDVQ